MRGSVLAWLVFAAHAAAQIITTVAGTTFTFPSQPLPAINAPLGQTFGVAVDAKGNVYATDVENDLVVRIAPDGTLTVVAGNGTVGFSGDGGPATSAALNVPTGVAVDSAGNIYIADDGNGRVRMVSGGIITTFAGGAKGGISGDGGPATSAGLDQPTGVAVDSAGNVYIADLSNRIRKVSGGIITTVAGNLTPGFSGDGGPATSASLNEPFGVAVDSAGNLYIADTYNFRIRKVSGGIITTVAGNGTQGNFGNGVPATSASLNTPKGVAIDSTGNLYIGNEGSPVGKVSGGILTVVPGGGGATGVAVDSTGSIYYTDQFNDRVRKVSGGNVLTIAGSGGFKFAGDGGPAPSAALDKPDGVAVDSTGALYISDFRNSRVRKVSGGVITTVAGGGNAVPGDGEPATSAYINFPFGVAVDSTSNVYIADGNGRVRKVSGGIITTIAGTGTSGFSGDGGLATSAQLSQLAGVAVDSSGNVYIVDQGNNRIRKISGGIITTIAGNGTPGFSGDGGPAVSAELSKPSGVAVDSAGNVYIADNGNNRVRKVFGGTISTFAGNGKSGFSGDGGPATSASLSAAGVAVDSGGSVYIADTGNDRVRKVSGGIIASIAGNGTSGFSGDGGPATSAELSITYPGANLDGLAVDSAGNVYFADSNNDRIREVLNASPSFQGSPASLTFSATAGAPPPSMQSIKLLSSLPGLAFSTSVSTSDGANWLSVSPSNGSMPAQLQASTDPGSLTAGTYQGTITVTSPGATPPSITVSVTFTVQPGNPPALSVSPASLGLGGTQGGGSLSGQVSVSNSGSGSLPFTASATTTTGGSWLSVSPLTGSATPTSPATLNVTANIGLLAAGTYSGSIRIAALGSTTTVPVTLSVTAQSQVILLSQNGLTFVTVEQGGAPLPQDFGILNTGQGSMSWSASASTLSGGSWLSIDQNSGAVAAPFTSVSLVNAIISPSGLKAGNYYGQIQVTSPGAANSPQSVSVVLNVLPAGSNPGPEVRPSGLIFIGAPGDSPGSQNVMVSNPEGSPITFGGYFFTVPTGGSWAQFLPTNATVQPSAPEQIVVQPNFTSLQSGVYQGFVSLGFLDGSSRSVHILSVVAPGAGGSAGAGELASRAAGGCTTLYVHPTALTDPSSGVTVGQPASLQARVVDNCGNLMTTGSLQATFSSGDAAVNLVHVGDGNWAGTWTPRSGTQPQVTVEYAAFEGQGVTLLSGSANLSVSVLPGVLAPLTFGAANAASGVGTYISPGGLVSIYGLQLADQTEQPGNVPFPKQVNGTQVLMGGKALPLRYVAGNQVNAQVPFDLNVNSAQQLVVQRDTTLSVPQNVVVAAAQPAVYTQNQSGSGPGVIVNGQTNALITSANPAHAGDVVVLYCNGLGAVNPPVPTGAPAPAAGPASQTVNPLTLTIGGVSATVQYAGLTPGYPDLYQVNAVVPAGLTPGDQPVLLTIAGQASPPVTIAVQ